MHKSRIWLAIRLLGLMGIVTIVILSLVPGDLRPHTGEPKQLEHFAAYALVAAVLCIGFSKARQPVAIVIILAVLSAVLEFCQNFIPGCDGNVIDFLASSFGACVGVGLAWILVRALLRHFP